MSAIRQPGKFNENTTLIDTGMYGLQGITAVYLVQGVRKCLIDAGSRATAPLLIKTLRKLDAFPPDLIVTTHPHSDHAQGVSLLREIASKMGKEIEVMAGREAIPLLAEGSFIDIPGGGPYESIPDATPVGDGDAIDLGDVTLRIYEVPGHCPGHIAALDEKNGTIFVGDAIGYKLTDDIFLPPFVPPAWDPDAFLSSVERLRQVPYLTLCLAHFGCICEGEAETILDEAVETCSTWWQFFERHADRLEDTDYLLRAIRKEINPGIPILRPVSLGSRIALSLVTATATVRGRRTSVIDRLAFRDILRDLAAGYGVYTGPNE